VPGTAGPVVPPGRGRGHPGRGLLLTGAVALAVSLAILAAVFSAARSSLWSMLDLHVYLWGGQRTGQTGNPYRGTYEHFNLYFTYPPLAALLFAGLSRLALPVVQWLITVASVLSLGTVLWLTWGQLGYRRVAPRLGATLLFTAVTLWLEPVQQTLAFGQINLLLMLIIVADLVQPDRRWWKGVGVGVAAGLKLTPLIFVLYLLLTRRYRAAGVAAATFAATILGSFVLLPRAARWFWLDRLFLDSGRVGNVAYIGNQSLYGATLRLIGHGAAHPYWLANVVVIGGCGLTLAALAAWHGQDLAGLLLCALTGLLVSPVSWSHHWVWVAPMLAGLAEFARRTAARHPGRWWRGAGWTAPLAVLALFFAYPFHLAPGAPLLPEGVLWAVPPAAAQGAAMTSGQEIIGNGYVLAGLVALTVTAAWLAAAGRPGEPAPASTTR
jgi:alpha-1,2-mannosyltransferase